MTTPELDPNLSFTNLPSFAEQPEVLFKPETNKIKENNLRLMAKLFEAHTSNPRRWKPRELNHSS